MAASPAQIAANRANALKSTGPRTEEGKEAARRNSLKHGLTGGGVVVPGEDEQEVALRAAALEAELAPGGSVLAGLLVRQVAIASVRIERAFRHETALIAERMRRAGDVFDDERRILAEELMGDLAVDPVTARRRLVMGPEGIDALVARLRALREQAAPTRGVVWDQAEGDELDRCLGVRPDAASASRVGRLTRAIVYDHWVGLDPAEVEGLDFVAKLRWAVAQIRGIIDAEIEHLEAHRRTLDPARVERGRAEAGERAVLDLGKDGQALRRYAGAAERSMVKMLRELRVIRFEEHARTLEPAAVAEAVATAAAQLPEVREVRDELASFGPPPRRQPRPASRPPVEPTFAAPKAVDIPLTIGRSPHRLARPTS